MTDCPACGSPVEDDAAACEHCGAALSARVSTQSETADEPADQGQESPQRGPPEGMQPPEGITGGPDRADQQKIGPLTRRQLLFGGGGAVAVAGAWYLFGGGSAGREPEAVLREYIEAVSNGDPDAASTTVHQDSPATEELVGQARGADGPLPPGDDSEGMTVDSVRELSREQAASTPNVESFVTLELTVAAGERESQETTTLVVTMAKNAGGLWKLWTVETAQASS